MLKLKNKELDVEEFALEYIKHDALLRRYPHRGNKYKRVVAYGALGRRFGVGALQARAFERLFRRHVYEKMESLVCDGLRDIDELPEELSWLALVEEKFKLLPKLLKSLGVGARPAVCPDALVAALCTQARLRGALCDSAVCAAVRRALRLAASDNDLQAAWESAKRLSLEYLTASARAGDAGDAAPHAALAHVADVVLLYSADTTLLTDESEQLYPEAQALSALWLLVQRHRLEERAPPRSRVRAQRWTRAHRDYLATGRAASLVVLQRRWHELKLRSRYKLLNYWRTTTRGRPGRSATPSCADPPREIHISVLKRYPHIVTSPLPSWQELVDRGLIVTRPLDDVIYGDTDDCVPAVTESRKRPAEDGLCPTADTDCSPVKNRCIKTEPDGLNIKYTYSSNVPCVVKAEEDVKNVDNFNLMLQNIKKEVDDETENNSYDDTQTVDRVDSAVKVEVFSKEVELDTGNNPNDDAHRVNDSVVKIEMCATDGIVPSYEVTVEFPVKDEPVSTMSSRITFLEDDADDGNGNGDEEDDSDDDDVEDDLDEKLLLAPRVRLSRVVAVLSPPTPPPPLEELHHELHIKSEIEHTDAVGQTRIMFEDDEPELDAHMFAVDVEEAESGLWRQHFQFRKRAARVSKAQQSLAVTLPHNNKLYILKRVEPAAELPEPDKNSDVSIEAQTLSSRQLTFLLHELTDVAMANHLLKRTQRPCCAARKHKDVSDARERMGLPPLPKHTHADGSACACCCARRVSRRPRHELDAERRALRHDLAAMLQDTRA